MNFQRARLDGIELEYGEQGTGEPVVLIHPGHFADWFAPLIDQPALTDRFRLVTYHRVGCAGSSRITGPVSLTEQAAHCRDLLRYLGVDQAHVVGHSTSGNIALQFAVDSPEVARSLAILEPALMAVPSAPTSRAFLGKAMELYRRGDPTAAIDTFLQGVCGPNYRPLLDQAIPGAFDQAVADADTFFVSEIPALQSWTFAKQEADQVFQPILAAFGERSLQQDPIWKERQDLLHSWFPQAESYVLPWATHLMQVQNPRDMAEALADFFGRHPISDLTAV